MPPSIILMMEVVCTSETSVTFNVTTGRYIPEESELHTGIISLNSINKFMFVMEKCCVFFPVRTKFSKFFLNIFRRASASRG
jgi:hypothetical protein